MCAAASDVDIQPAPVDLGTGPVLHERQVKRRYTLCVNSYAADFSTEISMVFASILIAAPWAAGS